MRIHPLAVLTAIVLVPSSVPGVSAGHSLEVGGGIHSSFDGDDRERFGTAVALSLGYSTPVSRREAPNDAHLILEVSYVTASDDVLGDPTFDAEESYRFIPILMGVRVNFVRSTERPGIRLYGGLGVTTVLGRFEDLNGVTDSSAAFGGAVELRPEFGLSRRVSLWIRQRVFILGNNRYQNFGDLNNSGACLQVGLSLRVDRGDSG